MSNPKSLIVNSPYHLPQQYWQQNNLNELVRVQGRRPAGYDIFDTRNNTRRTVPLNLVNQIRERVEAWRNDGYPGVTSVTMSLLDHWNDRSPGVRNLPFYFCQMETIETLIWRVDAPAD